MSKHVVKREREPLPCACGCGEFVAQPTGSGRPKKWVKNHARRKPVVPVPCSCGCGEDILQAGPGRRRLFLEGHHV
jgi:hypothetical protein